MMLSEQNKMDDEKEEQVLKKSRNPIVFVNHVDTYVGRNISKVHLRTSGFISRPLCDKHYFKTFTIRV
jgi:hypothetical protein